MGFFQLGIHCEPKVHFLKIEIQLTYSIILVSDVHNSNLIFI